jgi:hypothetical protein
LCESWACPARCALATKKMNSVDGSLFNSAFSVTRLYSVIDTVISDKLQVTVTSFRNIVVELLTLLLCVREVGASNLGLGNLLSWLRFSWFSSVPPGEWWDSILKLGRDCFLPHPFQFIIIHLSPCHWHYNLVTEKAP